METAQRRSRFASWCLAQSPEPRRSRVIRGEAVRRQCLIPPPSDRTSARRISLRRMSRRRLPIFLRLLRASPCSVSQRHRGASLSPGPPRRGLPHRITLFPRSQGMCRNRKDLQQAFRDTQVWRAQRASSAGTLCPRQPNPRNARCWARSPAPSKAKPSQESPRPAQVRPLA
jgi:hypothetical protein